MIFHLNAIQITPEITLFQLPFRIHRRIPETAFSKVIKKHRGMGQGRGCRRFRGRRRGGAIDGDARACCPSEASLQARPAGATAQGYPQGGRA